MKKSGETLLLLLLTTFGVAGCRAVGPCVGYGCPSFTSAVAAPQATGTAQNHNASTEKAQAQNHRVLAASSGQ